MCWVGTGQPEPRVEFSSPVALSFDLVGGKVMDFGRKSFAAIAAATALFAGAGRLSAQGGTITGRVTSQATGQPLAEARVLGIQTTLAATTGEDGRFTL